MTDLLDVGCVAALNDILGCSLSGGTLVLTPASSRSAASASRSSSTLSPPSAGSSPTPIRAVSMISARWKLPASGCSSKSAATIARGASPRLIRPTPASPPACSRSCWLGSAEVMDFDTPQLLRGPPSATPGSPLRHRGLALLSSLPVLGTRALEAKAPRTSAAGTGAPADPMPRLFAEFCALLDRHAAALAACDRIKAGAAHSNRVPARDAAAERRRGAPPCNGCRDHHADRAAGPMPPAPHASPCPAPAPVGRGGWRGRPA